MKAKTINLSVPTTNGDGRRVTIEATPAFELFGHAFVIHNALGGDYLPIPRVFTVSHVGTGLAALSGQSMSKARTIAAARKRLLDYGEGKVLQAIDRAPRPTLEQLMAQARERGADRVAA